MLHKFPFTATLPVTDLNRARAFYTKVLGLKEVHAEEWIAVFEAGEETELALYKRSTPTKADQTVGSFEVTDIEEVMEGLRAKGVVFEEYDMPGLKTEKGITTWGKEKASWFKDPDGNIIGLHQK